MCIYAYTYACIYAYTFACIYAYTYVCVALCVYMCLPVTGKTGFIVFIITFDTKGTVTDRIRLHPQSVVYVLLQDPSAV